MIEPHDAIPLEARYQQQAKAAVAALSVIYQGTTAERVATTEAAGRIAAALILANREGAP